MTDQHTAEQIARAYRVPMSLIDGRPWVPREDEVPDDALAHVIWDDDDGDWCDHPAAAVISDVNGDHFCSVCNAEWWEDPL